MAAGTPIRHKRKAGALVGGELSAGEIGVNTVNGDVYVSKDGTTVNQVNGGGGGGATNLSVTNITATTLDVASDTGTDATIPAATGSVAGLATAAQITKLNAITGTNTGDQTITLTGNVTGSGTGSFAATIAAQAVTYSKIQNVSATDKLLGRSTAGAGVVEEIPLTAAGRALIDDVDASAQRTTLGLGTLATQSGTFSGTSSGTNTGDQSLFSTIAVSGQSNVVADTASDTLTFVAGTNVTITTNAGTDTITIAAAGGGGATNLSVTNITATTLDVASDTGTDATIPAATASVAGLATAAQITKLDGIATGATANSSDATLLARANHTGTQAGSTVTGAYTAAALTLATAKLLGRNTAGTGAAEEITLGTNLSFTGTTLNAAGGGGGGGEKWSVNWDGQGSVMTADTPPSRAVVATGTITSAVLVSTISGSITITVKRYTPSGGALGSPTTLGTATLASAVHSRATGLSWSVTAGDVLEFVPSAITSIQRLNITIST